MALVKIVYVPDAERRGPDLDRIGRLEDVDPDLARVMTAEGSAVWPTDEDLASYEAAPPQDAGSDGEPPVDVDAADDVPEPDDLPPQAPGGAASMSPAVAEELRADGAGANA